MEIIVDLLYIFYTYFKAKLISAITTLISNLYIAAARASVCVLY